ncbi:hypothetical protein M5K25_011410 [Dendrobium thyrsiflorum]|uniref:Uncharacterized protein n=1 Tax=Dendrobium thyrsiflorum TaxID=117978 RepID=A0ABD0V2N2_DENTH
MQRKIDITVKGLTPSQAFSDPSSDPDGDEDSGDEAYDKCVSVGPPPNNQPPMDLHTFIDNCRNSTRSPSDFYPSVVGFSSNSANYCNCPTSELSSGGVLGGGRTQEARRSEAAPAGEAAGRVAERTPARKWGFRASGAWASGAVGPGLMRRTPPSELRNCASEARLSPHEA